MSESENLFGEHLKQYWEIHWWQMPEFSHQDLTPFRQIIVSFSTEDEVLDFSRLICQPITNKTRSVWFKPQEIGKYSDKSYE